MLMAASGILQARTIKAKALRMAGASLSHSVMLLGAIFISIYRRTHFLGDSRRSENRAGGSCCGCSFRGNRSRLHVAHLARFGCCDCTTRPLILRGPFINVQINLVWRLAVSVLGSENSNFSGIAAKRHRVLKSNIVPFPRNVSQGLRSGTRWSVRW